MDEPLSNLDAKLRVGMRASLAQLHARLGVTTVYVTHDQTEAMTLGQRVAVMRDGKILQVAEPQTLYSQPANLFVAAFIGSPAMNLVEALDRWATSSSSAASACPLGTVAAPSPRRPRRRRDPPRGLRGRRARTGRPSASHGARGRRGGAGSGYARVLPGRRTSNLDRRSSCRRRHVAPRRRANAVHGACRSAHADAAGRERDARGRPRTLPFLRSRRRLLPPPAGRRGGRRGHRMSKLVLTRITKPVGCAITTR